MLSLLIIKFQFYDSTIKRYHCRHKKWIRTYFNSTIVRLKDVWRHWFWLPILYFNSTIVRLKGRGMAGIRSYDGFQFYDSTIKSQMFMTLNRRYEYFNSTIVRLKVSPIFQLFSLMWNFNSTIVRLKVNCLDLFRILLRISILR